MQGTNMSISLKYKVKNIYGDSIEFQSDDIEDCIEWIESKERAKYYDYLDYTQRCKDAYEYYVDYYETYYVTYYGIDYTIVSIQELKSRLGYS